MKRAIMAALACLVLAAVAHAQEIPVADVAAGYSVLVVTHGFSLTLMGGSSSVAVNVNKWLAAVGDFGGYVVTSGSLTGLTGETYTFGPRFSYRRWERFTPFAQVLLGGGHASSAQSGFTGATNSFAFGAGGGADFGLGRSGRFALRPQVEYLGFRGNGNTTGTVRVSLGFAVRFGKKS